MWMIAKVATVVRAFVGSLDALVLQARLREDYPMLAEKAALESAVHHLAAGEPTNILGESYLDRVRSADPEVLARVLQQNGLNMDHVRHWQSHYARH